MLRLLRLAILLAILPPVSACARDGESRGEAGNFEDGRPNVLLILVDDLKPSVLGFEGDPVVRTPHLDRLAQEGTTFSRAYVPLPQCGPSRAALLVGRYPHAMNSTTNPGRWNPEHPALGQLMRARGYRTGMIGKWHLQNDDRPQAGFDAWCSVSRDFKTYHDPVLWMEGRRRSLKGFLPDVLTDLAIDFIDERAFAAARDEDSKTAPRTDAPFFLWLAFKAPHEPWTMPEGEAFSYERREIPIPVSFVDDLEGKPSFQREGECHRAFDAFQGKKRTLRMALVTYYAMITSLDANIGRILAHLAEVEAGEQGRETLVVFLSDNGYLTGEHQMFTKGPSLYEEQVRTPLLFHWPGHIPAGARRAGLASTLDILPTLMGVAGGEVPEGVAGLDLMPLIQGDVEQLREELFLEYERKLDRHVPILGVVTPGMKYVRYLHTEEEELYDLAADPYEMQNLAGSSEHLAQLMRLRERVAVFQRGIEVPFW